MYGIHDAAVAATRYRVDSEEHTAEGRFEQRLHENRDGTVQRARADARCEHFLDRGRERVEAVDPDHGVELTGHGRFRRVLDDRRTSRHEVRVCAVGPVEGFAQRGVVDDVAVGIDGVRERRGQDHAGQRRNAAVCSTGKRGGLAASERGVERRALPKVDHEWFHPVVTTPCWRRNTKDCSTFAGGSPAPAL